MLEVVEMIWRFEFYQCYKMLGNNLYIQILCIADCNFTICLQLQDAGNNLSCRFCVYLIVTFIDICLQLQDAGETTFCNMLSLCQLFFFALIMHPAVRQRL